MSHASKTQVNELESIKYMSSGLFWNESYAKARLLSMKAEPSCDAQLRGFIALCSTARVDVKPTHFEVQRRLCWFIGSLLVDVPRPPPPVAQMHSWSVLTPFYAEDLLYSAKELALKNEDGISVLYFLKTVHSDEWRNFLERVGVGTKRVDEEKLFQSRELALELRLWASFRGQTLARTVEGMMLNERALRLLASWEGLSGDALEAVVCQKFSYTVSCQAYGQHKRSRDPKAADTEWLLQRFSNLRVAYVDKASSLSTVHDDHGGSILKESLHYAVLIKGARVGAEDVIQEVFRVQLPGEIMLGEGKPENQNHTMIFTHGEVLQTIDINQCGYLEKCYKMRNLLHEFTAKPNSTILGFREHIFTGALSSLASYMEGYFVTLTQRVLYNPLHVRLHYGHPDVFDKVFSMTRGGISKASFGINLSEDISAGFNHLLRGGEIPYIEYVQVGKGRDVGMQQICKFEAKLASGNAEQCLSRDVYRIGQRLDFTRLLSFYFSGAGFYFNKACTVFAMFLFLYLQLFSHAFQAGLTMCNVIRGIRGSHTKPTGCSLRKVARSASSSLACSHRACCCAALVCSASLRRHTRRTRLSQPGHRRVLVTLLLLRLAGASAFSTSGAASESRLEVTCSDGTRESRSSMAAGSLTLAAGVKCTAVVHFRSLGALNYDLGSADPPPPPLLALPEHNRSGSPEKAVRVAGSPPRPVYLPALVPPSAPALPCATPQPPPVTSPSLAPHPPPSWLPFLGRTPPPGPLPPPLTLASCSQRSPSSAGTSACPTPQSTFAAAPMLPPTAPTSPNARRARRAAVDPSISTCPPRPSSATQDSRASSACSATTATTRASTMPSLPPLSPRTALTAENQPETPSS
mmetsp:Transcript_38681/g.106821  ORF Transcript_38681/g.106821 Transcript_38681/m.106821 type:complete len:862 (-) Transcript_38681:159-2744(-)